MRSYESFAKWKMPVLAAGALLSVALNPISAEARKAVDNKIVMSSASGPSKTPSGDMVEGKELIDKWLRAAQSLQDYSFNFQMQVTKPNGNTVVEKGALYFKQPRLLRIEVTGGPKAGSVAVLEKSGNIKAHMGGGLKFFAVTLAPDSAYLKSANGWPMVQSDFASLAQAVEGYIKEGCQAKASATPVSIGSYPSKVYDWTLNKPNGTLYKRALFDPQTMQPVEWWDYVDGKLFAHSTWTEFKPNLGLSDKTFTMKGDK